MSGYPEPGCQDCYEKQDQYGPSVACDYHWAEGRPVIHLELRYDRVDREAFRTLFGVYPEDMKKEE